MKYLDCITLLYFTSSNVDKPCLVLIEELPSSTSSVDGWKETKKETTFFCFIRYYNNSNSDYDDDSSSIRL